MELKTHEVIDLFYTEDEGNGVFVGTFKECNEFIESQTDYFTYRIVPMTPEQIRNYPDNQQIKL